MCALTQSVGRAIAPVRDVGYLSVAASPNANHLVGGAEAGATCVVGSVFSETRNEAIVDAVVRVGFAHTVDVVVKVWVVAVSVVARNRFWAPPVVDALADLSAYQIGVRVVETTEQGLTGLFGEPRSNKGVRVVHHVAFASRASVGAEPKPLKSVGVAFDLLETSDVRVVVVYIRAAFARVVA